MMWPYTIHLQPAQRELFAATVLTLLQEIPPGTIGPGTITQACRTGATAFARGAIALAAQDAIAMAARTDVG
jgi:hypothetical protein